MAGITLNPGEKSLFNIVQVVRQILEGRSNAVGTVTLTANAASTTVPAPTCGAQSLPFLFPMTAHAAAELASGNCFVLASNVSNGQFIISHSNNAQTDRTFGWLAIG